MSTLKGIDILQKFKNEAEVKEENGKIKLSFKDEIKINDDEGSKDFYFDIPTLNDLEMAMEYAKSETNEELNGLKQTYYLISTHFTPKIVPNDVKKVLRVEEMKAMNEVIGAFLS
jgi:hypothetical protein